MTPSITYRTDDATKWGTGIGRNLQPGEVDDNFYALAQAILALQGNPLQPDSIANVTVSGTSMSFTLTSGQVIGPIPIPVLKFRWRGAWQPNTPYAELDVFTVDQVGIFSVLITGPSDATFDPNFQLNAQPAYLQLFGAVDANLSGLSDVKVTALAGGQILEWNATDQKWENVSLGTLAFENANAVAITGGTITGLPAPLNPSDAVTKAYADGLSLGAAAIADGLLMANITGGLHGPQATALSDLFDHVLGNTRGSVIYRTGTGWVVLAPGAAGQVLKSGGAGADVSWGPVAAGVTDISAGTGISTGGSDITATGSISLAQIADGNLLANSSGAIAAPLATTLTGLLDHVFSSNRGSILYRGASGWQALAAGTSGQYLQTQGLLADPLWATPAGAGTVTSVGSGTGLAGGPITGTGTLSLAAIADGDVLANTSGVSAAPIPTTLTALIDHALGNAQGDVLYRNATGWTVLAPGTSGQVLQTGGAAANPSWANAPSGGPISDKQILANLSGASAAPIGKALSDVFDYILGSNRGDLIYRSASGWTVLAPGTAGQVLATGGASADPSWVRVATNLVSLSDVAVTSPTAGEFLIYDGAHWANAPTTPGRAGVQVLYSNGAGMPNWGYAAGASLHTAVSFATTAALPSCTYSNGTSGIGATLTATANGALGTIDGVNSAALLPSPVGYRLLVKNQADATQNGIYTITQEGDSTHPWILTRATDSDQGDGDPKGPNIDGGHTWFVEGGTANGSSMWMSHGNTVPLVMGTTQITFTQVAGAAAINVSGQLDTAFGSTEGMILYRGVTQWAALAPGSAGQALTTGGSGALPSWASPHYDIACFVPGLMTAGQKLLMHRFSKAVTIPANFGSYLGRQSEAGGSANATASTVITVNKAANATPTSFSSVGTITIAAGSVTPTFATSGGAAVSFAQGDVIQLVGPGTADATLADFCATLCGYET